MHARCTQELSRLEDAHRLEKAVKEVLQQLFRLRVIDKDEAQLKRPCPTGAELEVCACVC